jgi:hypothetical protein
MTTMDTHEKTEREVTWTNPRKKMGPLQDMKRMLRSQCDEERERE